MLTNSTTCCRGCEIDGSFSDGYGKSSLGMLEEKRCKEQKQKGVNDDTIAYGVPGNTPAPPCPSTAGITRRQLPLAVPWQARPVLGRERGTPFLEVFFWGVLIRSTVHRRKDKPPQRKGRIVLEFPPSLDTNSF